MAIVSGLLALLAGAGGARAQLDTAHWLPALWANNANSSVGDVFLTLSTPTTAPVSYTVSDGSGVIASGTVSNSAPVQHQLGGNGTYTPFLGRGHVVIDAPSFNTRNDYGLVITADAPVYAYVRMVINSDQAMSLTAKGSRALGYEFRALFMKLVKGTTYAARRGEFISVMATEPGTTTVTFDQIKPGIVFTGTAGVGSPATTAPITVTLAQHESYVIGVAEDDYPGTAPLNDLIGTRISADKLVAATSGSMLGGPATTTQDAGADQLVPVALAGKQYVVMEGGGQTSGNTEHPVALAVIDGTEVYLKGAATPYVTLDAGEYAFLTGQYPPPRTRTCS